MGTGSLHGFQVPLGDAAGEAHCAVWLPTLPRGCFKATRVSVYLQPSVYNDLINTLRRSSLSPSLPCPVTLGKCFVSCVSALLVRWGPDLEPTVRCSNLLTQTVCFEDEKYLGDAQSSQ